MKKIPSEVVVKEAGPLKASASLDLSVADPSSDEMWAAISEAEIDGDKPPVFAGKVVGVKNAK